MLLILVLALLVSPSLTEEEGSKKKKRCLFGPGILYLMMESFAINKKKKKSKTIPFRQKTHTQVT